MSKPILVDQVIPLLDLGATLNLKNVTKHAAEKLEEVYDYVREEDEWKELMRKYPELYGTLADLGAVPVRKIWCAYCGLYLSDAPYNEHLKDISYICVSCYNKRGPFVRSKVVDAPDSWYDPEDWFHTREWYCKKEYQGPPRRPAQSAIHFWDGLDLVERDRPTRGGSDKKEYRQWKREEDEQHRSRSKKGKKNPKFDREKEDF